MRSIKNFTYGELINFAAENRTLKEALLKGRHLVIMIFGLIMYSIFAEVLYHISTLWYETVLAPLPLVLSLLLYFASVVYDVYTKWHFSLGLSNGIWRGQDKQYRFKMVMSGFLTTASIVPIFTTAIVPITGIDVLGPYLKTVFVILMITFFIGLPFDLSSWKRFSKRMVEEEEQRKKKKS